MAVNKVIYGNNTLIDLTSDDVTAEKLITGTKAHDKSGSPITGTNPYEKTATDAEVTTQADLIAQIAIALEGKAAGGGGSGGSIETCTVEAKSNFGDFRYVYASVLSDGKVSNYLHVREENGSATTLTIENVICGSVVTVIIASAIVPASTVNNAEQLRVIGGGFSIFLFRITAGNNETATITVYDDD